MINYKNTENYKTLISLGFRETTGLIQLKRGVVELKVANNLKRNQNDKSYSDSYVIHTDGKIRHIGRDNSSVTTTEEKKEAKSRKQIKDSIENRHGDSSETRNISIVRKLKPLETEDDYNNAFNEILNLIAKRKTNESKIYTFDEFVKI